MATRLPPRSVHDRSSGRRPRWHASLGLIAFLTACRIGAHQPGRASPPDSDADGFYDPLDRCPREPGDLAGCADHDNLGPIVSVDDCLAHRETLNGYLDDDGCPDEIPVQVASIRGTIQGIYFDTLKSTIKPRSKPVLDRAASVLAEFGALRMQIACHESPEPGESSEAMTFLTLRRARAVRQYLIDRGIDGGRLSVRGAGWNDPLYTNETAAGRSKNRRCEFDVVVGLDELLATTIQGRFKLTDFAIYFDTLKTTITPDSQPSLDGVVQALEANPRAKARITCHESTAPGVLTRVHAPALVKFTLRRANAVKNHLVGRGIAPERITTRGAGAAEPVSTNETAAGRAENRRCDLNITTL